ncbi:MAG TPA: DNA-directed RNA polymerase subunit alpha C-terminal domain-containing protein, partial [Thermoanaerobaculia bacterium]|nr:DNA-directed RNA polymerase subunit alpha C-terminal domain-containing protein [Thermoanaerobaculia bacterium]
RHDGGEVSEELAGLDALLAKQIDELDLSVRSANSLKNANIHTLRDLVRRSEKDMLETKNFGKKSLEEVQEVLDKLGLSLGMEVPERPGSSASA